MAILDLTLDESVMKDIKNSECLAFMLELQEQRKQYKYVNTEVSSQSNTVSPGSGYCSSDDDGGGGNMVPSTVSAGFGCNCPFDGGGGTNMAPSTGSAGFINCFSGTLSDQINPLMNHYTSTIQHYSIDNSDKMNPSMNDSVENIMQSSFSNDESISHSLPCPIVFSQQSAIVYTSSLSLADCKDMNNDINHLSDSVSSSTHALNNELDFLYRNIALPKSFFQERDQF